MKRAVQQNTFGYGRMLLVFLSAALFIMCQGLTFSEKAYGLGAKEPQEAETIATLGKFAATTLPDKEFPELRRVKVFYEGSELKADFDPEADQDAMFREVGITRNNNFPQKDCATVRLDMFTGGANCCMVYYILSACPDADYAAYVHSSKGGLGEAMTIDKTSALEGYPAADDYFMYYSLQGKNEDDSISLSGVESPRIQRYIVFDGDVWRRDNRGEFPEEYQAALKQAAENKEGDLTARAISMAYYSYMLNMDPVTIKGHLRKDLPGRYADLTDQIYADIEKAVARFEPVTEIPLSRN